MLSWNDRSAAPTRRDRRAACTALRRGLAAVAFFLAAAAIAWPAAAGGVSGSCDVRFDVASTLHDFTGTARCRPFAPAIVARPDGRPVLPVVEAEVAVAEMDTGIGARNRRMREMLDAGRYPAIRATARGIDPGRLRREMRSAPGGRVPIDLALRIRDVERPVRAVAGGLDESGGAARFELEFPVSLREFGLSPPVVMGLIRVSDRVAVRVTVRLRGVPGD